MLAAIFAAAVAAGPLDLHIENAAVRLVVTPSRGAPLSVQIQQPGDGPRLQLRREGTALVLDGGQAGAGKTGMFDWFNQSRCRSDPKTLPLVVVRAPAGVRIVASGAVFGQVGASDSLMLDAQGCGRWTIGSVVGPLWMRVKGAITAEVAGHAPTASLYAWGASAIRHTGEVGVLTAEVHGSSNIRVKLVDGQVDSVVDGTGDVLYGRPAKGDFGTL